MNKKHCLGSLRPLFLKNDVKYWDTKNQVLICLLTIALEKFSVKFTAQTHNPVHQNCDI